MKKASFLPLTDYLCFSEAEMIERSELFYNELKKRRTVREFSEKPFPKEVLQNCLLATGTAPSGANMQPWHFVIVQEPKIKKKIRLAAEKEEYAFYKEGKAPKEWLQALSHFGTNEHKPFLEIAPALIVIFSKGYGITPKGTKFKHYYVQESVGIATGMLLTALHHVGLATLTHTPSPMRFLNEILSRPKNEKPFLILVTGYPQKNTTVPKIKKKNIEEFVTFK